MPRPFESAVAVVAGLAGWLAEDHHPGVRGDLAAKQILSRHFERDEGMPYLVNAPIGDHAVGYADADLDPDFWDCDTSSGIILIRCVSRRYGHDRSFMRLLRMHLGVFAFRTVVLIIWKHAPGRERHESRRAFGEIPGPRRPTMLSSLC